jgi:hypothetical protein
VGRGLFAGQPGAVRRGFVGDVDPDTFTDAGMEADRSASLSESPARALLTLAEACDGIYVLETVDRQGRRTW